jgi:hypothetical protein
MTSRNRSKNNVYICEGTTSRVMATDRPYGKFYDFYSVSPEYFRYQHILLLNSPDLVVMRRMFSEFKIEVRNDKIC